MSQRLRIVLIATSFVIVCATLFGIWVYNLDQTITKSIMEKQLIPTIGFYSTPIQFFKGQKIKARHIVSHLERLRYRQRQFGQSLNGGDYARWNPDNCREIVSDLDSDITECVVFRNRFKKSQSEPDASLAVIALGPEDIVFEVYAGDPLVPSTVTQLEPELFAQFFGPQPIIRHRIDLSDAPPLCLRAVIAIEDSAFLEHSGVSYKGILRAFYKNVLGGRVAQGGSTITQQLVKNYFLSNERTFRRKFKELFMAVLLETRASKDEILESYINEIYMGQAGPFQIWGYGAASEHYLSKPLADLNLAECALLASIVNSPGYYDPFKHPDRAAQRKELVLKRMLETGVIDEGQMKTAMTQPLPKSRTGVLSEPAPYFVDAVQKQIEAMGIDKSQGLRVFTTLSLEAQEAAQVAVREGVERLEKNNKDIAKLKEAGKQLEGLLVSSDPLTGFIRAAVGGRSFKMSQFNRLTSGHRQVGSVMKPFVFLAAMEFEGEDGRQYSPLSIIDDSRFRFKYDKQNWQPTNYSNKYYGNVPIFFALKESLNSVTARVAVDIGLERVVDLAQQAGVSSEMKPLPSLALGAFELYPWEVLQMYQTLSRFGEFTTLTFVERVDAITGETLFQHEIKHDQRLNPIPTAVVVGMMKNVILNGTGRAASLWGFTHPAAGKTGTTSEHRDSWFAGFTPLHTAVAWVGYDDNTTSKLTGASGALPIWTEYMKKYAMRFPPVDFKWPEGTKVLELDVSELTELGVPEVEKRPPEPMTLVLKEDDETPLKNPHIITPKLDDEEKLPELPELNRQRKRLTKPTDDADDAIDRADD
ncbi:MAG: transglycosylase domain-containing protein [Bdellovibrionales bacterium]